MNNHVKLQARVLNAKLLIAAAMVFLLSACWPQQEAPKAPTPPVTGVVIGAETAFYPKDAGLKWTYIKEGNPADAPKYTLEIQGPSIFYGKTLTAMHFYGNAADQTYYREFTDGVGVRLHGFSVPKTGDVRYEPPLLEYPPRSQLAVGASWGGKSTITAPNISDASKPLTRNISYTYTVLAKQQFKVAEAVYDTFRIVLEVITEGSNERVTQTIHFTAGLGEVRTKEGLLLVGKNF